MLRSRRCALALGFLLGALRFAKWSGSPLTGDEAYMLRHYASQPASFIASHYEVANNHVLLAIVLREIDERWPRKLIGTSEDLRPLRLVPILCSVGTLALTFEIAQAYLGFPAAWFAVLILGVSSWHLLFAHLLRGYGPAAFLGVLNIWLLLNFFKRRRRWLAAPLILAVVAWHYLIPVNVVFTAALLGWLLFMAWQDWTRSLDVIARDIAAARPSESLRRLRFFPIVTVGLALSLALSLGFTIYLYLPIARQVLSLSDTAMTWPQSLRAIPQRLAESVSVLGVSRAYRLAWLATALVGAAWLFVRRRRRAGLLVLGAFVVFVPVVIATLQRNLPPARVFLPALPVWAILAAAGVQGLIALGRRRLLNAFGVRIAWVLAALIVMAAASPELSFFLRWRRGLDLAGITRRALALAGGDDDFALVYCYEDAPAPRGSGTDSVDWEYYGFASNLLPYGRTRHLADAPYLSRRRTFFAALGERAARAAARASGIDRFEFAALRRRGRAGALDLYEVSVDSSVLAAYQTAAPGDAEALTGLGVDALRRGDDAAAERQLARAATLAPKDERAAFQLAWARYLRGDPGAAAAFERVLSLDPKNAAARLYLADVLTDAGRPQKAADLYLWYFGPERTADSWVYQVQAQKAVFALRAGQRAVARAFSTPRGCLDAAIAYERRGSYDLALRALERVEKLRPWNSREAAKAAEVALLARRYADGERWSRKALALGAGVHARLSLAYALFMRGDAEQVRRVLETVTASFPGDWRFADFAKAAARLDGKGQIDDEDLDVYNSEGLALLSQKKWEGAIKLFRKILMVNPDHVKAHANLAIAAAELGRAGEAEEHFQEALRNDPYQSRVRFFYGNFLARRGKLGEAAAQYRQALGLDPNDKEAMENLRRVEEGARLTQENAQWDEEKLDSTNDQALALAARGEWDKAISVYRAILSVAPRFFKAHNNLAVALAAQGHAEEAYLHFQEANSLSPGNPGVHFYFGNFLANQGKLQEAMEEYREALRLDPNYADAGANLKKVEEYLRGSATRLAP